MGRVWDKFDRDTREVAFLFKNKKIAAYCTELRNRAANVIIAHRVVRTEVYSPNYQQMVQVLHEGMEWFTKQAKEAEKRFKPFLQVRD